MKHIRSIEVDKAARPALRKQKTCVLWFTGLCGAGKTSIATNVEQRLYALGLHTYLLDGDNIRQGLSSDLGFEDADRLENVRRMGEIARLMTDAGLIILIALYLAFSRRLSGDRVPRTGPDSAKRPPEMLTTATCQGIGGCPTAIGQPRQSGNPVPARRRG